MRNSQAAARSGRGVHGVPRGSCRHAAQKRRGAGPAHPRPARSVGRGGAPACAVVRRGGVRRRARDAPRRHDGRRHVRAGSADGGRVHAAAAVCRGGPRPNRARRAPPRSPPRRRSRQARRHLRRAPAVGKQKHRDGPRTLNPRRTRQALVGRGAPARGRGGHQQGGHRRRVRNGLPRH